MAWEPRVYNASTVHRVPRFAPAPLCVGFYGFGLFATVPRGLPPQYVKVPGRQPAPVARNGLKLQCVSVPACLLSVARLPGLFAVFCVPWTTNKPAPGQLWARGCVGTLYRCPRHNGFFLRFPGCSPRHRAGNNPAKPRQHKQVVHRLYNPPRPRFRSRLRPSHLAPAPAVAYNQPGPGCSRIHPAKCVFQCGFCCWYGTLKANTRDYLPTARKPYTAPRSPLPRPPTGDTQQFLQVVPQPHLVGCS